MSLLWKGLHRAANPMQRTLTTNILVSNLALTLIKILSGGSCGQLTPLEIKSEVDQTTASMFINFQWSRRRRKCSGHQSRDSPAVSDGGHGEAVVPPEPSPWKPMEEQLSIHLQPVEVATIEQVTVQRRLWSPGKPMMEQGPVWTCEEWRWNSVLEEICWLDLWPCGKDWGCSSLFLKN